MKPVSFKFRYSLLLFVGLFGLTFHACQDEIDERSLSGFEQDFYPLEVGKYWEYQMDSVIYSIGGSIVDSTTSFIREEIVDTYVDATGDTIARFDKSWKRNIADSWEVQKAFTATISGNQVIRTEDNLRLIKLVLPPSVGSSWDSNAFIDPFQDIRVGGELVKVYKDWNDVEIKEREAAVSLNGNNYDDLVTVFTTANSIIELREVKEQYAKGVGLVAAKYMILDTQCNGCGDDWIEKAEQGFTLTQLLLDHN